MKYTEFLNELNARAEEGFAVFQRRLIFTDRKILGVRTPTLRKLVKELPVTLEELLAFPDDCYETVFMQLAAVSSLSYESFLLYLPQCVEKIDNWALCDCFKANCIRKHKDEFLPVLRTLFQTGKEYLVRYVLVTLLSYYVEEKYLPVIKEYIRLADTKPYYVRMAVAWLVAEILIKSYDEGVSLLKSGYLDEKTHGKAIQKAIESYRVTNERKEFLRSLKIKNKLG